MDPDQWSAYALLEQGIEEGQRLQQIRIAQSLKRSGSPADFIAQVTGFTIAEVLALKPDEG